MNDSHSRTNVVARKIQSLLQLIMGLTLLLLGTTTLAGEPIPGVENPSDNIMINTSRSNIKRPSIVRHEEANSALGQVSTTRGTAPRTGGSAGEASIFDRWGNSIAKVSGNGQIGEAPDLPSAAISTTRSNIKRPSSHKDSANSAMGAVSTTRGFKIADNNSPIPTDRGIRVAAGDLNGDGVEKRKAGEPIPGVDIYLGTNGQ